MTFTASATAQGYAFTNNKTLVTSTASASATSDISYDDALNQATELAQEEANVTALYDANLINQAVSETHQLQNYNMTQINSAPDLTFYFSVDTNKISTSNTSLGETAIFSTYYGPLYSDINLSQLIGDFTANQTIYNINNDNKFNKASGLFIFYLKNGSICKILSKDVTKDSQGLYITIPGTYLYQIASGTEEYLNKSGIIEMIYNNETLIRTVNVYFNN